MTAILKNSLKTQLLDGLLADVDSSGGNYYIGIGRSQEWPNNDTPFDPSNCIACERDFRLNIQSIKVAEDVSYVIPRYNWTSGTIYSAWDDAQAGYPTNSYYVLNDENGVYICLQQGKNANGIAVTSTIKPTGISTAPAKYADGYVWKYLYTVGAVESTKFLSANYMPVRFLDYDSAGEAANSTEEDQFDVQTAAVPGQILGVVITSGGTGYTSAPTVTFEGDGSGASATATIASGTVTKVEMDSDGSGGFEYGSGYKFAAVTFSDPASGTTATGRVILGPKEGIGANPTVDLKSTSVMFNTKPNGIENGDFIVGNDFRQIGLIRNIQTSTGSTFTGNTGLLLDKIVLSSTSDAAEFTLDQIITGDQSDSQAIVDYIDSDTIYYHQNTSTGFGSFDSDTTISASGVTSKTISSLDSSGFDKFSGNIFYIENRAAIERSAEQTEDIKIIVRL
jgi:hypothetical protein